MVCALSFLPAASLLGGVSTSRGMVLIFGDGWGVLLNVNGERTAPRNVSASEARNWLLPFLGEHPRTPNSALKAAHTAPKSRHRMGHGGAGLRTKRIRTAADTHLLRQL